MALSAEIGWWIVFMLLSAFFSGMEVAFAASDKLRYALAKKSSGVFNFMLNAIYGHPRQFLTTLTIGNQAALVLFVYFTFLLSGHYAAQWGIRHEAGQYLLIILFSSAALLLTGEFLPRVLFKKNPDFWVRAFVLPAFVFYILLYPVAKVFLSLSNGLLRLMGVRSPETGKRTLGRVDLDSYVKQGIDEMAQEKEVESEVKIFRNALDFSNMKIRDCMVPRAEIVAVSQDTDLETLKDKFIETGISRILVYRENIDNIVGYIHIWEIFNNPKEWTKSIASIGVVPESMQANKLMNDLMQQRKSIAVVVDEFGGTSGIVTMEDLVEEIFGDIEDEYDTKAKFVKRESETEFVLSGRVEIDYLNEKYGLEIPESDEYSTVAGYLLHHAQRFPKTYETIIIGNYTFKILKVTARKIEVVRLIEGQPKED